jgi:hypothetical protein
MPHNPAHSYVGWRDAFGTDPPPDGLRFYLQRLPKTWLVEILGKIGTTLFNSGSYYFNPNQQIEFIATFKRCSGVSYAERIARLIASDASRTLVHPSLVATLTSYALLYGSDDERVPGFAWDHLLRAILLLNTQYGRVRLNRTGNAEDFLPYEIEIMLEINSNFGFVMARYFNFMQWASEQRDTVEDYIPIQADVPDFLGMPYEEYAAAAFAVVNPFMSRLSLSDWQRQPGFIDMNAWLATLDERRTVHAFLDSLAIDPAVATAALLTRPMSYGLADLRPFVDKPLLQIGDMRYACPYQGFLRNRLGEGLYWAIFDGYKRRGQEAVAKRFTRFFGHFFEQYIFGLIQAAMAERSGIRLFPEQPYRVPQGQRKSSDVTLISGETAVFIEVTHTRFPLDEALCDRAPDAIDRSIQAIFVRKARQLNDRINDYLRGSYNLDGVDPTSIKRIFPVIVTEQHIPQLIALPRRIRSAIRQHGFLTAWEDVQFACAEDAEALYVSSDGKMDLDGILVRKAAMPQYVHRDLATYLYDNENEKIAYRAGASVPGYRELTQQIVLPTLRRLGLPSSS